MVLWGSDLNPDDEAWMWFMISGLVALAILIFGAVMEAVRQNDRGE